MKRSYYVRRIIPCTLVILVCLFAILMSIKVRGHTDEQRFRLAEQAQLVGPSKIIGKEDDLGLFGDVILGETEHGYTLFECESGELHYRPKAQEFTVICPIDFPENNPEGVPAFPVVLFPKNSSAVRAKLTLQIYTTNSGAVHQSSYCAEAERSETGCFPLLFHFPDAFGSRSQDLILEMLNNQRSSGVCIYGKIIMELYDSEGNLLETCSRDYYVPETL